MSFPQVLKSVIFPVDGFPERENNPGSLKEQFIYRHWKLEVAILQEGPEPLHRCDHCGINIPAARLLKHRWMERCNKTREMRLRQRDVDMAERYGEMDFSL